MQTRLHEWIHQIRRCILNSPNLQILFGDISIVHSRPTGTQDPIDGEVLLSFSRVVPCRSTVGRSSLSRTQSEGSLKPRAVPACRRASFKLKVTTMRSFVAVGSVTAKDVKDGGACVARAHCKRK